MRRIAPEGLDDNHILLVEQGERLAVVEDDVIVAVVVPVVDFIRMGIAQVEAQTRFLSNPSPRREHPFMQTLIGLEKETTVPVLIEMLREKPAWVPITALFEIMQDESPVIPEDDRGRFDALVRHWLNWYKERSSKWQTEP